MEHQDCFSDPRPLVAVLAGGFGAERSISEASGRAVCAALADSAWRPVYVDVSLPESAPTGTPPSKRPVWTPDTGSMACRIDLGRMALVEVQTPERSRAFDAAFIALHGVPGEDGWISAFLDMLGLPHTASGLRASAVSFDKELTKVAVAATGMALAKGTVVWQEHGEQAAIDAVSVLRFPLFVKPNRNGSSCGISRVEGPKDLPEALAKGWAYGQALLVEEAISGREFTCAVYSAEDALHTLPICEIVSGEGHAFFDYEAKYTPGEADELIPAPIDEALAQDLRHWSKAAYRALGLSGLARIDFIVEDGRCFFLEANTVPGLSEASIVPRMLRAAGLEHGRFYTMLLEQSLASARKDGF